ncbi:MULTISPECIES: hypothetical protein [unclassified Stenotrophomonas]|uniref:hypothetical protein n=1 Tax=unclassified Stenotrophomonas TaxID=196198 RepID=UPI000D162A38|nr:MULTISPECIES: hypothetical protein [unclassified Stenotrophomonas]PTA72321.1 hypothetical protein C9412_07295 [Stenotrophomonas sp. Nf1]PTA79783.1 hypothetical protein C9416_10220 [Stenotrophomonas sp. Nf4]
MNDKKNTPSQGEIRQGSEESRQDRKQDDVARQRPGQRDQQVRDAHSRSPQRKDGGQEPA